MPTLAEIRTQFPEYDDMPDDKLAGALHQKFYPDMPRADFDQRIGFKAPDPTGGRTPPASYLGKTMDAATAALTQGATFGFADEVGSAGSWVGQKLRNLTHGDPTPAGQVYDESLAANRKQLTDFHESNPASSIGLQVLGGFTGGLPAAAPVTQVAPTLGTRAAGMLGNARAAAIPGAVAGFGSGEGGLENRATGAIQSGVLAGAAGAALPSIANATVSLGGKIGHIFGWRNADKAATNHLMRAFERDGITMEDAGARLGQWEAAGAKPEALFDLGGENVRGLARAAAGVPGEARQRAVRMLTERQEGQGARIADDVAANISANRNFRGTVDEIMQQRAVSARPLYEDAFTRTGAVHNDRIAEFIRDPIMRQGINRGLEIQRLESLAERRPFNPNDYAVTGFNEAGDAILGPVPNLRLLDAAKRGLDNIIENYRDPTSGRLVLDQRGRAIDQVRRSFVREIDDHLGGDGNVYQQARNAWAGPSQSLDAINFGRSLLRQDAEISAQRIRDMAPGDREFVRVGLVRALQEVAEGTRDGADITKRMFATPAVRQRIEAAFDSPADFARFAAQMRREADMYRNAQDVSPRSGSQTEPRRADAADMEADPAGNMVEGLARGHSMWQSGMNAARDLYRRGQGINSATGDALATRLFTPGHAQTAATIQQLAQARAQRLQDMTTARQRLRGLLDVGGTDVGVLSN